MIKTFGGQPYEAIGMRRDGTAMRQWRSLCADCGEPFVVSTPISAAKFSPNRRCAKHKRPGCRVKLSEALA